MTQVAWNTPVFFENPTTWKERTLNCIESYTTFGKREYAAILQGTNFVEGKAFRDPILITALKVISYVCSFFIIPAFFLILKACLRKPHTYATATPECLDRLTLQDAAKQLRVDNPTPSQLALIEFLKEHHLLMEDLWNLARNQDPAVLLQDLRNLYGTVPNPRLNTVTLFLHGKLLGVSYEQFLALYNQDVWSENFETLLLQGHDPGFTLQGLVYMDLFKIHGDKTCVIQHPLPSNAIQGLLLIRLIKGAHKDLRQQSDTLVNQILQADNPRLKAFEIDGGIAAPLFPTSFRDRLLECDQPYKLLTLLIHLQTGDALSRQILESSTMLPNLMNDLDLSLEILQRLQKSQEGNLINGKTIRLILGHPLSNVLACIRNLQERSLFTRKNLVRVLESKDLETAVANLST